MKSKIGRESVFIPFLQRVARCTSLSLVQLSKAWQETTNNKYPNMPKVRTQELFKKIDSRVYLSVAKLAEGLCTKQIH